MRLPTRWERCRQLLALARLTPPSPRPPSPREDTSTTWTKCPSCRPLSLLSRLAAGSRAREGRRQLLPFSSRSPPHTHARPRPSTMVQVPNGMWLRDGLVLLQVRACSCVYLGARARCAHRLPHPARMPAPLPPPPTTHTLHSHRTARSCLWTRQPGKITPAPHCTSPKSSTPPQSPCLASSTAPSPRPPPDAPAAGAALCMAPPLLRPPPAAACCPAWCEGGVGYEAAAGRDSGGGSRISDQ